MKSYYLVLIFAMIYCINCGRGELDSGPPTISILSHTSGQFIDDTTIIKISTSDDSRINSVEFFINDSLFFVDKKNLLNTHGTHDLTRTVQNILFKRFLTIIKIIQVQLN